jgi:tetratricopeptide (TPR) repeat protein
MAVFPWSELGLDGPADERGIRRAYAARLKVVRPDLDAAAFQRLVEARDVALRAVENLTLRPVQRPVQPATPPAPKRDESPTPKLSPPPEMRTLAPVTTIDMDAPTNDTADTRPPPSDSPPPVEIEISAGARPPGEPKQPPSRPRPVTGEPEPPASEPPHARPRVERQSLAGEGQEAVSELLIAFVEAWTRNQALPPPAPILKLLGEQSIVARQKLEIEALRAVATVLDKGLFDANTPETRQVAARLFLVGLDDDYGWTSNDRRLYMMMQQPAADQMIRLLRAVREWERTGVAPNFAPPPQKKPPGTLKTSLGAVFVVLAVVRIIYMIANNNRPPNLIPPHVTPPAISSQDYATALQTAQATSSFSRGVTFDSQGQIDRAIQEYDQAIRLNPNHALAFYNRGLDYANKGQFDRAIADYDQAVRLNPLRSDNFVSRGVARDARGEYDRAIQDYDQALRLKPGYALALVDRGVAYANKEQYDRAIQDYDAALRLNPNDGDALRCRGEAKRAKGDIAGGDADLARAEQLATAPPPPKAIIGSPKPSK